MSDLTLAFNAGDEVIITTKNGEDLTGDSAPLVLDGQEGKVIKINPGEEFCYFVKYGPSEEEADWFKADEIFAPS